MKLLDKINKKNATEKAQTHQIKDEKIQQDNALAIEDEKKVIQ